jgi:hypothetical protein
MRPPFRRAAGRRNGVQHRGVLHHAAEARLHAEVGPGAEAGAHLLLEEVAEFAGVALGQPELGAGIGMAFDGVEAARHGPRQFHERLGVAREVVDDEDLGAAFQHHRLQACRPVDLQGLARRATPFNGVRLLVLEAAEQLQHVQVRRGGRQCG